MNEMILLPGREKSLRRHHPWIFSGAVAGIKGDPAPGETLLVRDARGQAVALAAWSPASQLCGRVWSFDPAETIDREFFRKRLRQAIGLRQQMGLNAPDGGCRLVASEADALPGWIVDRYGDWLVIQCVSAGADRYKDMFLDLLMEETGCRGIYERSDVSVRQREKLPPVTGTVRGETPPDKVLITEDGVRYHVDIRHGHKTGFYFDQRENRIAVKHLAKNRRVLNCFAYTGGFGAAALAGGATHVINVDSSAPALALAERTMQENGFTASQYENRVADVFALLREYRDSGRKFDLVVLDPPKFVENKGALPRGCRAYQDIARLGFQLLNPGGLLFTFSCSGLMEMPLFQKLTADAALDAGVQGRIIRQLGQSADHPTALAVPETFYLKGLVVEVQS
ncbi:MAG: class I SAM-dependent methyltransferase [Lentisphaeria bacterium]|nr:class I SAM-dependent methyltransferase [Lentisphaeria bacterium]